MTDESDRELVEAGLTEGLDAEARAARLALLRDLRADGVELGELKRAIEEGRLPLLPVDRALTGERRLSARDVAAESGLQVELLLRIRRAAGLAEPDEDEAAFDERDLDSARRVAQLLDAGVPEEGVLEITRVIARGMSQGAEALRTLMVGLIRDTELDERELALRNARAASELLPTFAPLLEYMLRVQLREQVRNEALSGLDLGASPAVRSVAVAFADVVGFTRLGERSDPDEIGGLVGRLTDMAAQALVPPARIVKTIGDAVMVVAPEPRPALDTALALVEQANAEDFPRLRAGVALGAALSREGDWYGRPVNLASRVTGVARAGSVLATKEVRDALPDGYSWSAAGGFRLKGVKGRVPLYRARAPEPA